MTKKEKILIALLEESEKFKNADAKSLLKYIHTTNEDFDIPATGFFVAIGHKPNTDIFADYLTLDETGYIVNVPGSSKTNISGVFVGGDAADHVYRQAITAAGTGCMAALDAERYLASKE